MSRLHEMKTGMSSDEAKAQIAKMKEDNIIKMRRRQKLGSDKDVVKEGKGQGTSEKSSE